VCLALVEKCGVGNRQQMFRSLRTVSKFCKAKRYPLPLPVLSSFARQQQLKFFSTRLVDDIDQKSTVVLTSKIDPDDPLSHEIYRYDIDFKATCQDPQYIQEGGYIDLTPAEMEKYLPEGGAGEMIAEMQATNKNAFMVRESSKLVCRFVIPLLPSLTLPFFIAEFLMTSLIKSNMAPLYQLQLKD
jgi:hypothetical protein